ncbi:MAG: hypothetical protein HYU66_06025 [Armatimonadetes bacterium]|nr:hypothetical protein [Armatimonadota bacterium]
MRPDPVIDEIRRVRREICAEFGNDPARMLEYFAPLQAELRDRLVDYGGREPQPPADNPPSRRGEPA